MSSGYSLQSLHLLLHYLDCVQCISVTRRHCLLSKVEIAARNPDVDCSSPCFPNVASRSCAMDPLFAEGDCTYDKQGTGDVVVGWLLLVSQPDCSVAVGILVLSRSSCGVIQCSLLDCLRRLASLSPSWRNGSSYASTRRPTACPS